MDGIIDRYDGKEEFVRQVLTWNFDGISKPPRLDIHNGFVYYRTDYA